MAQNDRNIGGDSRRNADQEWSHYLRNKPEPMYGRNTEEDYRGHLPPPFYNGKEENSLPVQYPSEASFRNPARDPANYGRGGYYGSTYDQESYDRERQNIDEKKKGYSDNYRKLGDRRWHHEGDSLEAERRAGYRSDQQRLRSHGDHSGKGPRAYRRSDGRILEDMNERLYDDPFVDASDIEVTVADGNITLIGTVQSRGEKRRAEDIAEAVSGVKNIENRLRVRAPNDSIRESTERSNLGESMM